MLLVEVQMLKQLQDQSQEHRQKKREELHQQNKAAALQVLLRLNKYIEADTDSPDCAVTKVIKEIPE